MYRCLIDEICIKTLHCRVFVWKYDVWCRDSIVHLVCLFCFYCLFLEYFFQRPCLTWNKRNIVDEWKTNLMTLAILFHLLCVKHVIPLQELATVLMNYHIGRLVLSSLCVGALVRLVFGGVRFAGFSLQNEHHPKPAAPKAPTHNELRTRRPMW